MTLLNFFPWHEFSVGQAPDSSASSWMSNATNLKFAWFTYIVMTLKFSKGSLASAVKSLPAETREASGELNILTVSIMISSRSVFLVEYIWGFLRPAESSFYVVEFSMLNGDLSKFCLYSSHRMAARRRIVMNQQPPEVPPSSHTTEPFRAKESLLIRCTPS